MIEAFARFLVPFYPASSNDWTQFSDNTAIDGYVSLLNLLQEHLLGSRSARGQSAG